MEKKIFQDGRFACLTAPLNGKQRPCPKSKNQSPFTKTKQ